MADNKTKPTQITVEDFLATVTPERRVTDARTLIALMARLTDEPATMWGPSIIGFGRYRYTYESGRSGEMPRLCFSPRKPHLVLYGLLEGADHATLLPKLGTFKTQVSCSYVKTLDDIDMGVLETLLAQTLAANRAAYP